MRLNYQRHAEYQPQVGHVAGRSEGVGNVSMKREQSRLYMSLASAYNLPRAPTPRPRIVRVMTR